MVKSAFTQLRAIVFVAVAVCAGVPSYPANAQETGSVEQQLPPPDPNQPAPPSPVPVVTPQFTRDQADALLAASEATDVFEIVTLEENRIGLRHRGSGIVCRFSPDFQNRINVVRPGRANSDVGCISGPWPSTTLGATRSHIPPGAFIASMEQGFRRENPNSQPFQPSQVWPAPARDAVYLHLVSTSASGARSVIHAVAVRRGDWTIISRMSYAASGDLPIIAAELAAAAHFESIFADLEN